jgi:hypothetical protein
MRIHALHIASWILYIHVFIEMMFHWTACIGFIQSLFLAVVHPPTLMRAVYTGSAFVNVYYYGLSPHPPTVPCGQMGQPRPACCVCCDGRCVHCRCIRLRHLADHDDVHCVRVLSRDETVALVRARHQHRRCAAPFESPAWQSPANKPRRLFVAGRQRPSQCGAAALHAETGAAHAGHDCAVRVSHGAHAGRAVGLCYNEFRDKFITFCDELDVLDYKF